MKLTNEIKEILEDVVWWDTCPTEYKFKINAYLKSVNESKALNIDLVSKSFYCWDAAVGEKCCVNQCVDCENENKTRN